MQVFEYTDQDEGGRPVSAASSTSSFRIPGINTNFLQQRPDTGDIFAGLLPSSADSRALPFRPTQRDPLEPANFVNQALQSYAHEHVGRDQVSPSRPFTASSYHRSRLMTADGSIGNYVCAILENRGIGREVGIASIDRDTGLCIITQFADTPTYVRTIHHLSMHPPSILLVPASAFTSNSYPASLARGTKRTRTERVEDAYGDAGSGSEGSMLVQYLEELFDIQVSPVPRRLWNHQDGARYLDKLLVDDAHSLNSQFLQNDPNTEESPGPAMRCATARSFVENLNAEASTRAGILVAVAKKYYLLSALSALFDFFTETFNRVFTPKSLRIRYVVPEGTVMINSNTAHDLELVSNLIDPKSKDSLFGLMNQCATPMGRRLLKTNILQPLTDKETIEARQDAVSECIRSEERFYAIRESMKPLKDGSIDLDRLINSLSTKQKRATSDRLQTETKISNILSLRTLLRALSPVRAALQGCNSGLLQAVATFLDAEPLDTISHAIDLTINEDVVHAKGGLSSRNAKMYAVKAERSPLLDVARETYRENVNDILELCDKESRDHGLKLSAKMITTGFLFQTTCDSSQVRNLSEHFTNVSRAKTGKNVTMMTLDLKKLNARLLDSMNEVCSMSDVIITELREAIVGSIASLYKVSEAISLLDMIISFTHVSIANAYVRPSFGDTFDVQNARHPLLDRSDVASTAARSVVSRRPHFVPNDIHLAPEEKFCLVTGPNMSGKSTFLRQVALLTVMAGVGCFVPADRATLPIPDAMLSLLTHEEDPAQNLSTFAAEMRTSAFILSVATPRSLIILDEMGRGTSPDEGCAMAVAISEELIESKRSTVFFATHFGELIDGLEGREGVVCRHLQATMGTRHDADLVFHHKLHAGPGLNSHYSLQVAKMMGCFSASFLQRAEQVAAIERERNAGGRVMDEAVKQRRRILRNTVGKLQQALLHGDANADDSLLDRLQALQLATGHSLASTYE